MALGGWDEKRLVKSPPFQIKKLRSCLKNKLKRYVFICRVIAYISIWNGYFYRER